MIEVARTNPSASLDEREAPFRERPHEEVLGALVDEGRRKLRAYEALAAAPDPTISFTGVRFDVERLAIHSRSEAAIHRWDLVGGDEVSERLLAAPDLTGHAVWALNHLPGLAESARSLGRRAAAAGYPRATITFRAANRPDVVLRLDQSASSFGVVTEASPSDLIVTLPAAHRLLVLWGRRPIALDANANANANANAEADIAADVAGDLKLWRALDGILWPEVKPWPSVARGGSPARK